MDVFQQEQHMYKASESSDPVVVLGAKPEAKLPDVPAQAVVTANGAVELATPYKEKCGARIIGLVPAFELKDKKHIAESFQRAVPDEIIVFDGDSAEMEAFVRETLGITEPKLIVTTIQERHALMEHALGSNMRAKMLSRLQYRGWKYFLRTALWDLLGKRQRDWLTHSTGLDAIMFAQRYFPNAEIITAGIAPKSGEHFNQQGQFLEQTAISDRDTLRFWPKEIRPRIFTTDSVMSEVGDFPLWEGQSIQPR